MDGSTPDGAVRACADGTMNATSSAHWQTAISSLDAGMIGACADAAFHSLHKRHKHDQIVVFQHVHCIAD